MGQQLKSTDPVDMTRDLFTSRGNAIFAIQLSPSHRLIFFIFGFLFHSYLVKFALAICINKNVYFFFAFFICTLSDPFTVCFTIKYPDFSLRCCVASHFCSFLFCVVLFCLVLYCLVLFMHVVLTFLYFIMVHAYKYTYCKYRPHFEAWDQDNP